VKHRTDTSANQSIVPNDLEGILDDIDLLAPYWKQVTQKLHPLLEITGAVELSPKLLQIAKIFEIVRIEEHLSAKVEGGRGRKQIDRRPIARAFLAKAAMNLSSTRQLIQNLQQSSSFRSICGMENVPSEPTFSRAFAEFASEKLNDRVHVALVEKFIGNQIVQHCSHDTTAVEAREKAAKKEKKPTSPKKSEVAPRKERFALPKN
jgi:transposase